MTDERTYQMLWDCPMCGTEKLLGKDHRHCPNCGAPQDPDRRYFPKEEDKVEVEDHAFVGADRICPACDAPQSAAASFCGNCGSPFEGAKTARLVADGHTVKERTLVDEAPPTPEPPKKVPGFLKVLAVGIVAAIAIFLVFAFWTEKGEVTVAGHSWERSIQVETFSSVREGDWCDRKPSTAYDIRTSEKQRDTKQVPDGQDCKMVKADRGDGTFTEKEECTTRYREEPVMDQWCDFKIDKWVVTDTLRAQGDGLSPAPTWPTGTFDSCKSLGCTREGRRSETYDVTFTGPKGAEHSCTFDIDTWQAMSEGSRAQAEFRVMGGGVVCDSVAGR